VAVHVSATKVPAVIGMAFAQRSFAGAFGGGGECFLSLVSSAKTAAYLQGVLFNSFSVVLESSC
jgi:hypothetical protein